MYVIKIRREVTTGTGKVVARRSPFQPEGTSLEVTLVMGQPVFGASVERRAWGSEGGERWSAILFLTRAASTAQGIYSQHFFFLSRMAYHVYEAGPPRLSYPNRG